MSGTARRMGAASAGQQAVFAMLVAVALAGLALAVADKMERLGTPNVGWLLDERTLSPTRPDVSEAGLRGGGRALSVNGVEVSAEVRGNLPAATHTEIGAVNTLVFRAPRGEVKEIAVEVRPWTAHDFLFTHGGADFIGLLFLVVGVAGFALRPFEPGGWALLSMSCFAAGAILTMFLPFDEHHSTAALYFLAVVSFAPATAIHAGMAFPVSMRAFTRAPRILWIVYGAAAVLAAMSVAARLAASRELHADVGMVRTALLLGGVAFFIGRCAWLGLRAADPIIAQRARILVGGAVLGVFPFAASLFVRSNVGDFDVDSRLTIWPVALFVLALARVAVRHELLNARIAVRRAVLYTGAVAVLTVLALFLISVRPYAVAVLLFPLLYLWPRFDARLQSRLYPQRARFPELLRAIGADLARATRADDILEVLAAVPDQLCNARRAVAILLEGTHGPVEAVRGEGGGVTGERPLADEPLIRLLRTTRREIDRAQLAVEPQFANIRAECTAGFERLGAELLLPLVHEQRVIGALAVGPRAAGDPYEEPEIDALSTAAQQAVQALVRVEAMEALQAREIEFADLKRFFPPQVIDQVMARGGAAEIGSKRRLVTIVFADLRGFTAFADGVEPEELMATLAEYHATMGRRIAEHEGTLERFAGDGFMVFFNDPVDQPDHALRAARMALAMRADVDRLRDGWLRKGYRIHIGIGIHTGYATCGFVGYEGRRDYSVIGNVTNLAARLSDWAAPGEILVSARTHAEIDGQVVCEPAGELELKGFHQPCVALRLLDLAGAAPPAARRRQSGSA